MNRLLFFLLLSGFAALAQAAPLFSPAYPISGARLLTDTIPPLILCPQNDTVVLAPNTCSTTYDYFINAADNEPGWTLVQALGLPSGASFPIGNTLNVFLVTDAAGNTANCSFTLTVKHFTAPSLVCKDLVPVGLDANCAHTLLAAEGLEGGPYGCLTNYLVEVDKTPPFGNGPWMPAVLGPGDLDKTYQYRITDPETGNKCWGNVSIADLMPPILSCQNITLPCVIDNLTPAFLKDSLGLAAAMPTAVENCGGAINFVFTDATTNLPCDDTTTISGIVTRTWTAVDVRGNATNCVQTIYRSRLLADLQVPANITLSCHNLNLNPANTGRPYIAFGNRQFPLTDDSYCEFDALSTDTIIPSCDGSRQIQRNWTLYDACLPFSASNPKTGVQLIDIVDNAGPALSCPANLTVSVPGGDCLGTVAFPNIVLADLCSRINTVDAIWSSGAQTDTLPALLINFGGNNPNNPDTMAAFGTVFNFPVGPATVVYRATDDCGKQSTCSFTLTVWDLFPPSADCAALTSVVLDAYAKSSLPAAALNGGSTDACNPVAFKVRRTVPNACQPNDAFYDTVEFCCADAGDTIAVTLRVYDVLVPPGTVPANFATAHASDCTALVVVQDTLPASCIAPADTAVSCSEFDPTLAPYGSPVLTCRTDGVTILLDYTNFDSSCANGTLLRTFQTFHNGVAGGQCSQQITVDYLQDYYVRFPDDVVVTVCNSTGIYGEPVFFGQGCEDLEANFTDEVFTVVPDACYKIERTWTILNRCNYDSLQALVFVPNPTPVANPINSPANLPGPVVSAPGTLGPWAPSNVKVNPTDPQPTLFSDYWSADANGYRFKQIIKFIDSHEPVSANCPSGAMTVNDSSANDPLLWNEAYWWNPISNNSDLCEGAVDLRITTTDACAVDDLAISYLLFLDTDGNGTRETAVSSANLPGTNTIYFDNAGNPNYSGGTAYAFDERNVGIALKYRFGIDEITDGTQRTAAVRWFNQAEEVIALNNETSLVGSLPQLPFGTHRIKWTIKDLCGNQKICEYNFTIQDAVGSCLPPSVVISGNVRTNNVGVQPASVMLSGVHPILPPFIEVDTTDDQGHYVFATAVPMGADFTVEPKRNDDPMNGVSTFDLVLMSKHVLGIEPLNSPYKIICADINKSNSVTTFDIVELRKLILGIYTQFPANTSWRFVPEEFNFPDPANPFQTNFPEIIAINNLQINGLLSYDFIGLKIGDVNGSVIPNAATPANDRGEGTLWFHVSASAQDFIQAGDAFSVTIQADETPIAYQFTLEHPGLDLLELRPESPGLGLDNFAVFAASDAFTSSWNGDERPVFRASFRARTAGRLREMLAISDRITRTEAYLPADPYRMTKGRVALRFDGANDGLILYQNNPNPFSDQTTLSFYLPRATIATLTVFDLNGRIIWTQEGNYAAGEHRVAIDRSRLGAAGVFYYQLKTPAERAVRKMVLLEKTP